jgi:hypothetical protein
MNGVKRLGVLAAACGVSLALAMPSLAAGVKSPDRVKSGLLAMTQTVADTNQLIAAKSYGEIGREGEEFAAGVGVLRKALLDERAALRSEVNPLLSKAVAAADRLTSAGKSQDEAKITAAHRALAGAVEAVVKEFPEDVRP